MRLAASTGTFCASLVLLLLSGNAISTEAITTRRRAVDGKPGTTLFLLTGYKPPQLPPPAGPKGPPKGAEVEDGGEAPLIKGAEMPPKPLPQIMLPRNMTAADALKPPLGAAQVAPPPKRLVDVDVCRGYFDVMGQFDNTFNCSKGTYIYCCGTCHYRFCCEHQRSRLDQDSCTNYISPVWATTQAPSTLPAGNRHNPDFETLQQQSSSTAYVIGGVITFTVVVAVGIRIAFSKVSRRPRNRDINMPRALVDILRHQSSPVQPGDRNSTTILTTTTSDGRTSKTIYTPVLQSKDNRKRVPRMNNSQIPSMGTLLSGGSGGGKHSNSFSSRSGPGPSPHPSFSHSFHNLAQLPPSYEAAMKPEISRYSSLKRLERDLDEYTNYYNSKRRSTNAPPAFHSSQHYLPWAGDYTLGTRGTLPLHGSRPHLHMPPSTPNPYPLPVQPQTPYTGSSFDRPPRRVRSQDQLLAFGEGNTLSRLSKNQQHQYYKAMMSTSRSSTSQTLRRSHERLLVSPDRLEDRLMGMGLMSAGGDRGGGGGMVPTMGRLSHQQKTQSQQNICVTPSMDRHHIIKMNSQPTSGHDHDRGAPSAMAGMGVHSGGGGWDPRGGIGGMVGSSGGGGMGGHPSTRRMAFATKRQSTIEQLHFIPGGGGGGGGQGLRTASKNEVTV